MVRYSEMLCGADTEIHLSFPQISAHTSKSLFRLIREPTKALYGRSSLGTLPETGGSRAVAHVAADSGQPGFGSQHDRSLRTRARGLSGVHFPVWCRHPQSRLRTHFGL